MQPTPLPSTNPYSKLSTEQAIAMLSQDAIPGALKDEIRRAKQLELALHKIITVDPTILKLKEHISMLALRNEPVLIEGETGTGKTYIAKALHGYRTGKFIQVNCSALSPTLIESELFGHEAGAFTGAIAKRDGKFKAASGGTIFLDEIGDMPLEMQSKLLITLQEQHVTPVGSNNEIPINCRVVAATNKDMKKEILEGRFRKDLYFRLGTFELKTTPLRSRKQDIHEALDAVYDKAGELPTEIRDKIAELPLWGNYRELEILVLRYKVLGIFETEGSLQKELL